MKTPRPIDIHHAIILKDAFLLRTRCALRQRRLNLGYYPSDLAIPGLLSEQTIRNFERGTYEPNLATHFLLSLRLGLSVPEVSPYVVT